jgi:hypothetical protein
MTLQKKRPPITWDLAPKSVRSMLAAIEESAEYEIKNGKLLPQECVIVTKEFMHDVCKRITALQKKAA